MKTGLFAIRMGATSSSVALRAMQQGGVIMDVVNPEQAAVAEELEPWLSWLLSEFLLTSEKLVAWHE